MDYTHRLRLLSIGVFGGTIGFFVVGMSEALYSGASFLFAISFYGVLGALIGAGIGLMIALFFSKNFLGKHTMSISGGCVAFISSLAVARYLYFKDIWQEHAVHAMKANIAALVTAIVLAALMYLVLTKLDTLFQKSRLRSSVLLLLPVLFLAVLMGYGFWGQPGDARTSSHEHKNAHITGTILIIADALRADVLGAYNDQERSPSPYFDQLAKQGMLFEHTSAQASWTKPAVASILTGLLPNQHGATTKTARLSAKQSMASVFAQNNYKTAAVVTNYNLSPRFNFDSGFHDYHYLAPARYLGAPQTAARLSFYNVFRLIRERFLPFMREATHFYWPADVVSEKGLAYIDSLHEGKFFLYLHYMDTHDPFFTADGKKSYARVQMPKPSKQLAQPMKAAYLDEVRRFDNGLQQLVEGLKARGLINNVNIAIVADHGEEFADHGDFYHGTSLYQELIHVPLLLVGPAFKVKRVSTLVRQIDIFPTLLAANHLKIPDGLIGNNLLDGQSLQYSVAQEDHQNHILESVIINNFKLITANKDNPRGLDEYEVYDLQHDPTEQKNIADKFPQQLETLQAALKKYSQGEAKTNNNQAVLDPAAEAELRALGYIE